MKQKIKKGRDPFMFGRTDLALEAATTVPEEQGISQRVEEDDGRTVTRTTIHTKEAAAHVGKPMGQYITVEVPPLTDNEDELEAQAQAVAAELAALLPEEGPVLVVGLGNASITPDALGPQAADMVLATRHIQGEWARSMGLDDLRPVAVLHAGVLGKTGVESGELTRGLCRAVQPVAVIAVDALAARSLERLGRTVQLCDTGIAPGSGVGNNRRALTRELLGVPVIGMGVPTVVDAATIVREMGGQNGNPSAEAATMIVTPREVDVMVRRAARLVAMAINAALQPDYSPLELIASAV